MDKEQQKRFWHTSSHILAQAILRLYPKAKLTIGPATENGFYYDFDDLEISEADLGKIEQEMKKIVKEDLKLERFELARAEALEKVKAQPYKVELINDLPPDVTLSFYTQGDFTDLCAGPHLESTGAVGAIKLLSIAGAYWRGSEKNKMLTRIYGISFPTQEELDAHLNMLEEAKKRDHRVIGKDLFRIFPEGPGFPSFLPKGMIIRNELEKYWKEVHDRAGYDEIRTPIILSEELWHTSGHWDHYKDNMYTTEIDGEAYAVKPMNCPGGMLVYASEPRSYRDLPLKLAERGLVHRHEKSGQLHGLMRVRCFTQDDAHLFMTPEQTKDEVLGIIALIDEVYEKMGFEYKVELSTRPEDSMGSEEDWELATEALREALEARGIEYVINEGDGAFYGPKIDFHLKDCIGRTWQCGTIQMDFQMPKRFGLVYTDSDGQKKTPIMVHRVVLGSMERFMGILMEHTMCKFPTWLSPVQVDILPISEKQMDYAQSVAKVLKGGGIRVELDQSSNTFGKKIRESALRHTPYAVIIGDKEISDKKITVKNRDSGEQVVMDVSEFRDRVMGEIKGRIGTLEIGK